MIYIYDNIMIDILVKNIISIYTLKFNIEY